MTRTLHISPDLELPANAVTQTFAFLARRGAGKTYAASKLCEEMLSAGAQVVVLDPVGNWYGLRLAADGKRKGFDIPVFGGLHGDIPLEPGAGALVADLVADKGLSIVLDVSMFRKGERKTFATAFAEQLFHRKKEVRSAVHLFIEEAQVFVPQRVGPDEARMLGAFEDLVKLGRNFGIGVTLISQRPQAVNKDALNQTEALFVLQTNGSQERKALKDWIVDAGMDVGHLVDELPGLKRGVAYVWSPSWLGITKKVHICKKETFDASATPELGASAVTRELAPVDLEKIKVAMKDVVTRAEEADPRALRRKIAALEAQLRRPTPAPAVKERRVEVPVITDAQIKRLEAALARHQTTSSNVGLKLDGLLIEFRKAAGNVGPSKAERPHMLAPGVPAAATAGKLNGLTPGVKSGLGKGEIKMLHALALRTPNNLTKRQLGLLSGYAPNGGTFKTYLPRLKSAGYVQVVGDNVGITDEGLYALGGTPESAPKTPEEVRAMWLNNLGQGERRILEELIQAHGEPISKQDLGERSGYSATGGTFKTYLPRLKGLGLVDVDGQFVRAADALF